jgi:hypothetical protein
MCVDQQPIAPPSWFYSVKGGVRDWTHANAVIVDAAHNQLIVSIRHLDAVVALRYHADASGPAGQLRWELGPHGTLEMLGDGTWQYHQHDPELESDGTMLLFDNGNRRPGTASEGGSGAPPFSRAVRYELDLADGTVRQLWQHRATAPDGKPVYAPFLGDADQLSNGDVLITYGGPSDEHDVLYARIIEVKPGAAEDGSQDTTALDVTVKGSKGEGWTVYRADRLASIYGIGRPDGVG